MKIEIVLTDSQLKWIYKNHKHWLAMFPLDAYKDQIMRQVKHKALMKLKHAICHICYKEINEDWALLKKLPEGTQEACVCKNCYKVLKA